jgi:YVTN family beta-propeller protein
MQVTRHRRPEPKLRHRRAVLIGAGGTALAVLVTGTAVASTHQFGTDRVGEVTAQGQVVSSDQYIAPRGDRLVLQKGKIMSSAVSPDGTHLAAAVTDGGMALAVVDLKKYAVQQYVGNNAAADLKISSNDVGQEGPVYSPDGSQLWLGQADGYRRFTVASDGSLTDPVLVPIAADGARRALASGAVFSPDGSTLYAAVNGQNRVVAVDTATGTVTRDWAVGNAPRDLARVGNKLYVSNEGGRPAEPGESTINSYGTQVPASPVTAATTTGTVSVIDLSSPSAAPATVRVGLHPTALLATPGAVFVTNTADNTVSVIDPRRDAVVQTIATQPWPEAKVGYEPDAVALTGDGHLLVTLGRADAVAVYRYTGALAPVSYVGLLPTDYFPAEIATVGKDVVVSNTRGVDARRETTTGSHATHDTTSSLTRFRLPDDAVIRASTATVFRQNGWTAGAAPSVAKPGHGPAVPVPVRLGEPSPIKHVFLIVKENRTFDQLFGDVAEGDGDPALAQYGENVTPNQHALARRFGLFDNTYDIGTNSAEGHNWLMQADNPEYTESSAGEYLRSYDTEDDALGHQRTGFLWTGAQAAGRSVRDFGEFQQFLTKPADATWANLYCDSRTMATTGKDTAYPMTSSSPIPSLNDVSVPGFPKFDTDVPDIYRYEIWKRDFEKRGPADLNMFWLSSDHTGGPPSGAAQVADNDLATGRIVDKISHSKYWRSSAIFVVEDDSQAGLDHVDGHRAPIQIISPWARHGVVDSRYYTQITMIRTIEQILGIHPMNQKDTAASPMSAAFTRKPDYTPFTALPNRTSLTAGLATPPPCGADEPAPQNPNAAPAPRATVPPAQRTVAREWARWKTQQRLTGPTARADSANPAQMNHFDWYDAHDWARPYPGETTIVAPADVPGAGLPAPEHD